MVGEEMQSFQMQIGIGLEKHELDIRLDEDAVAALVLLIRQVLPNTVIEQERRHARIHASQHAPYGGQEPPMDMRLLVDTREAAELFGVSERTVASWNKSGRMPAPIRIGRAVRWGYDELRAWVAAGCPPRDKWRDEAQ